MRINFAAIGEEVERAYTSRLAFRPVTLSDAWPLFEATRNPLFNKYLLWRQPEEIGMVHRRVELIMDAHEKGQLTAVSVVEKQTGRWVSLFRLLPYARDPKVIETGIWTHPEFWQGRVSLEVAKMMIDCAFLHSNCEHLVGAASPENAGSCFLMTSAGAQPGPLVVRPIEGGGELQLQEFWLSRQRWQELRKQREVSSVPRLIELSFDADGVMQEPSAQRQETPSEQVMEHSN